ncbi:MAG: hypothetical protein LBM07_08560 [Culturomica sp.]|jgi:hypothetical protein|nr:hypothetical protein [Culturomica sp.]
MEILLPNGERIKLAKEFGVSNVTVWKALTGRSNSLLSRNIRKAAIERGGTVYHATLTKVGDLKTDECS